MRKNTNRDLPYGKVKRIKDFLPRPSQLVYPRDTIKVTILLSKPSVEFFKKQARKYHTKYQKMIREVIDQYTEHHS